jgi:hypothetical protein
MPPFRFANDNTGQRPCDNQNGGRDVKIGSHYAASAICAASRPIRIPTPGCDPTGGGADPVHLHPKIRRILTPISTNHAGFPQITRPRRWRCTPLLFFSMSPCPHREHLRDFCQTVYDGVSFRQHLPPPFGVSPSKDTSAVFVSFWDLRLGWFFQRCRYGQGETVFAFACADC